MRKPQTISVSFDGVTFTGTFTPEEPMVMYYKDGSGYPGSPADFEITKIEGDPIKLVEFIETIHNNIWPELSEKCLEKLSEI